MSAIVADIIDAAADVIVKRGFWKGGEGPEGVTYSERAYDPDCTCAGLAITLVSERHVGEGNYSDMSAAEREAYGAILDYLGITERSGRNGEPDLFDVARWNDHKDRTKDEVLSTLRAVAAKVRSEA